MLVCVGTWKKDKFGSYIKDKIVMRGGAQRGRSNWKGRDCSDCAGTEKRNQFFCKPEERTLCVLSRFNFISIKPFTYKYSLLTILKQVFIFGMRLIKCLSSSNICYGTWIQRKLKMLVCGLLLNNRFLNLTFVFGKFSRTILLALKLHFRISNNLEVETKR